MNLPVARAVMGPKPELPTSLAVFSDPFQKEMDRRAATLVMPGQTLEDLAPKLPGAWLCQVDDRYVSRADWGYMPPPGALVIFQSLPGKGNSAKQSLRIALTIALIYATGGAFSVDGGSFTLTAAAQAAIVAVGTMVINALIPLDYSNSLNRASQQYSAQAQGNIARIGQPIPEIFGFDNGWPDLAAQPYASYEGNEQFLHCILCVGRGQYTINQVSVGDTPLTSFGEATVIRLGPGQAALTGPGTGQEGGTAQALVDTKMHAVEEVAGVELKTLDYAGPYAVCPPERRPTKIFIDIALPMGLDAGRSITWKVEVQDVDDFGAAIGAWSVIATETYNAAIAEPLRKSYSYTVTGNRKRCRLLRTDTRSTTDGSRHDISWIGLRCSLLSLGTVTIFDGGFTFTEHPTELSLNESTFILIKIRATGQLSGALRFRVMSRRMLPVWGGTAWSAPTLTRNPAWALARVLKARGVADANIDLAQLLLLSATWAARQDNFDYRFDSISTTWDALSLIARVGRAVPLIRGDKYTFARDQQETTALALYGMRNIRKGSFSLAVSMPSDDPMQALDLEYWDHRRWDWVTVSAQIYNGLVYGYRGAAKATALGLPALAETKRGRFKMPGIVGENHAIRTAVYMLAEGLYRRLVATYSTDLDGLLPPPLGLIVLQHDLGDFGQGGDVVNWSALTVSTSEPLRWELGVNHYMRLMKPNGTLTASIAVTQGATAYDAVLASDPGFTPLYDDASRDRTRYVFGPSTSVGALAKVRTITPRSANEIEHKVVLEDDRVHSADKAWLPGSGEQDPLSTGASTGDTAGGSTQVVNLTDHTFNILNVGAVILDFRIDVHNDGRFSYGAAGGPAVIAYWPSEWLNPQTVTAAIAALYEVKVDSTSATSGDSVGTWLPLGTSRFWSAFNNAPSMTYNAVFTVSIRDVATQTLQDSCVVSYTITDNSP